MANIFFNFFRIGAIVILSIILFFSYVNLPESLAVNFNETGNPSGFISKQTFFYWSFGLVFLINFLFLLLRDTVIRLNFEKLLSGIKDLKNLQTREFLKGWFSALLAFINTYLIFVVLGIYKINSDIEQKLDFNYNYLLWIGILGFLIILIVLPYKLLSPQSSNEN